MYRKVISVISSRVLILITIISIIYLFVSIENQEKFFQRGKKFTYKIKNLSSVFRKTSSHLKNTMSGDGMFIKFGLSSKEKNLEPKVRGMYNLPIQYMHIMSTPLLKNPFIFQHQPRKTSLRMVLGIPTVKRQSNAYIMSTLKSIFSNEISNDTLIVVMIAEQYDFEYVKTIAQTVSK